MVKPCLRFTRLSSPAILLILVASCTKVVDQSSGGRLSLTQSNDISCVFDPVPSLTNAPQNHSLAFTCTDPLKSDLQYTCTLSGTSTSSVPCNQNAAGHGVVPFPNQTGDYIFKVEASDPTNSARKAVAPVSFKVDVDKPVITALTGNATSSSALQIQFSGNDIVPDVVGQSGLNQFLCHIRPSSNTSALPAISQWTACGSNTTNAQSFNFSSLQPSTAYNVFVVAKDVAGNLSNDPANWIGNTPTNGGPILVTTQVAVPVIAAPGTCSSLALNTMNGVYTNSNSLTATYTCARANPSDVAECSFSPSSSTGIFSTQNCTLSQSTQNLTSLPDGSYDFCVRMNNGSASSESTCKRFVIDRTPPAVVASLVQLNSFSASVAYQATDAGVGVKDLACAFHDVTDNFWYSGSTKIASPSTSAQSNLTWGSCVGTMQQFNSSVILPGHEYEFFVRARDNLNQESVFVSQAPQPYALIFKAPLNAQDISCMIQDPYNGAWINTTNPSYTFLCAGGSGPLTHTCQVKDLTSGSLLYSGACDDQNHFQISQLTDFLTGHLIEFKVLANDQEATTLSRPATDTFKLDTTPPTLTMSKSNVPNGVNFTFASSDTLSGVNPWKTLCTLTDSNALSVGVPCTSSGAQLNNLNSTLNYVLKVVLYDNAGNSFEKLSTSFKPLAAYSAPVCVISDFVNLPIPPFATNAAASSLNVSCSSATAAEVNAECQRCCRLVSTGQNTCSAFSACSATPNQFPLTYSVNNNQCVEGSVVLNVRGVDPEYPTYPGQIATVNYNIDKTPPVVTTLLNVPNGNSITTYFSGVDNLSGVDITNAVCTLYNTTASSPVEMQRLSPCAFGGATFTSDVTTPGSSYRITVVLSDLAGNTMGTPYIYNWSNPVREWIAMQHPPIDNKIYEVKGCRSGGDTGTLTTGCVVEAGWTLFNDNKMEKRWKEATIVSGVEKSGLCDTGYKLSDDLTACVRDASWVAVADIIENHMVYSVKECQNSAQVLVQGCTVESGWTAFDSNRKEKKWKNAVLVGGVLTSGVCDTGYGLNSALTGCVVDCIASGPTFRLQKGAGAQFSVIKDIPAVSTLTEQQKIKIELATYEVADDISIAANVGGTWQNIYSPGLITTGTVADPTGGTAVPPSNMIVVDYRYLPIGTTQLRVNASLATTQYFVRLSGLCGFNVDTPTIPSIAPYWSADSLADGEADADNLKANATDHFIYEYKRCIKPVSSTGNCVVEAGWLLSAGTAAVPTFEKRKTNQCISGYTYANGLCNENAAGKTWIPVEDINIAGVIYNVRECRQTNVNTGLPVTPVILRTDCVLESGWEQHSPTQEKLLARKIQFAYSGSEKSFVVPQGVSFITAKIWGAGGCTDVYNGGAGGFTTAKIPVIPGQKYVVIVGGKGHSPTAYGYVKAFGGGGRSSWTSGINWNCGGGGLSGIFKDSYLRANAVAIAGGGGGGEARYSVGAHGSPGNSDIGPHGGGMSDMSGRDVPASVDYQGGGGGGYNGGSCRSGGGQCPGKGGTGFTSPEAMLASGHSQYTYSSAFGTTVPPGASDQDYFSLVGRTSHNGGVVVILE